MSMISKPVKYYEGIDSDKENNNVLNKMKGSNKNNSDVKQQIYKDTKSNVIKSKVTLNDSKEDSYQVDIPFHQTNVTDNHKKETSDEQDSQVAGIDSNDNKAIKKKLKKLRKKLKKQFEKVVEVEKTRANTLEVIEEEDEVLEQELRKELVKADFPATSSKDPDHVDISNDDKDNSNAKDDSDEEMDFLNNIPAFVHAAIKKDNKKSLTTKMCKQSKQDDGAKGNFTQTDFPSETLNNDNNEYYDVDLENDFTLVKYKHSKHPDSPQSSEDFAILAFNFILDNQISQAIQHLSTAISLDPKNVCHLINRGFCFLRSGTYNQAMQDAKFIIKKTSDNQILAKAYYLLGHAYYGLKNYEEAEKSIQKCLELFPQDLCYIRELLRFKVSQLVNMGFCEKEALLALKSHSNVMDAMETLITKTSMQKKSSSSTNNRDTIFTCYDENEVFYSDDEDNCSNTQLLSSIIREKFPFHPNKINKRSIKKPVKTISKKTCKFTK